MTLNTDKMTRLVKCTSCGHIERTSIQNPKCPNCKWPLVTVIPPLVVEKEKDHEG